MKSIRQLVRRFREKQRIRRASLPWDELEAEAERQHCSAADIFFDRAGRTPPRPVEADVEADAGSGPGFTLPRLARRRHDSSAPR